MLDNARLGKQRLEALQLLQILTDESINSPWRYHNTAKMWKGHEKDLCEYGKAMCDEWISRGYKDAQKPKFEEIEKLLTLAHRPIELTDEIHKSHQSNLIRKKPEHYRPLFGNELTDNLPYIWPVKKK